jgi:hypothetical protein
MDVAIFNEVATNEIIEALKSEGVKYAGLYVDMNDPKQRKYVKDNASHIKDLKKKVDRKRIDVVKDFKIRVEKEAASITEDLNIANLPFESLIDEYAAERKVILDAEKADKESRERAAQLEIDHEFGLLMNDKFDSDKVAQENERIAYEKQLKAEAIAESQQALINAENQAKEDKARADEQAKQAEIKRVADVEQARINEVNRQAAELKVQQEAESARLANVEHVRGVNNLALNDLIELGLTENNAKIVVTAIAKKFISNVSINY